MSLGFHITVVMYILFEVQIIGDLHMFIQTPASVGLIFRAWKCMIDCCSAATTVEEVAQRQHASSGGVSNRSAVRWRRERKQRRALIVVAAATVEEAAQWQQWRCHQQKAGCWRRERKQSLPQWSQRQDGNNGGASSSKKTRMVVIDAILQGIFHIRLYRGWCGIFEYTQERVMRYIQIHVSAQSVYT